MYLLAAGTIDVQFTVLGLSMHSIWKPQEWRAIGAYDQMEHPMTPRHARIIFLLAAAVNIPGVLLFSLAFTNKSLFEVDPGAFSPYGVAMIMVWGGAYLAASSTASKTPWIALAFAVEKLAYVLRWSWWMSLHSSSLSGLFEKSFFTGAFFAIYGVVDFFFMILFFSVFWRFRSP